MVKKIIGKMLDFAFPVTYLCLTYIYEKNVCPERFGAQYQPINLKKQLWDLL